MTDQDYNEVPDAAQAPYKQTLEDCAPEAFDCSDVIDRETTVGVIGGAPAEIKTDIDPEAEPSVLRAALRKEARAQTKAARYYRKLYPLPAELKAARTNSVRLSKTAPIRTNRSRAVHSHSSHGGGARAGAGDSDGGASSDGPSTDGDGEEPPPRAKGDGDSAPIRHALKLALSCTYGRTVVVASSAQIYDFKTGARL